MPFKKKMGKYARAAARTVSKATKKYVKKAIVANAEHKAVDFNRANTAVSAAGNVIYISGIAQGNTDYQRVGAQIKPLRLQIRGSYFNNVAGDEDTVRIIVFKVDLQSIAGVIAGPTLLDVLADNNAGGATDAYSFSNLGTNKTIKILYDKTFMSIGNSGVLGLNNSKVANTFVINIPLSKKMGSIQYLGTGVLPTSGGKNALYVLTVCNNGHVIVGYTARLTYTDQ